MWILLKRKKIFDLKVLAVWCVKWRIAEIPVVLFQAWTFYSVLILLSDGLDHCRNIYIFSFYCGKGLFEDCGLKYWVDSGTLNNCVGLGFFKRKSRSADLDERVEIKVGHWCLQTEGLGLGSIWDVKCAELHEKSFYCWENIFRIVLQMLCRHTVFRFAISCFLFLTIG